MRNRSLNWKPLKKPISQLLMPGEQQIERGALPIVPGGTVAFVNCDGSNTNPPCFLASHCTSEPAAYPGAQFGSPGASKNVLRNCSMSSDEVMRTGKPVWNVTMPETCQPLSSCPLNPSNFGTGSAHTELNTNRWRASNNDGPYVEL